MESWCLTGAGIQSEDETSSGDGPWWWLHNNVNGGFPGGAVVKNPPANAGDTGSSPGPGRSHTLRSN